ALEIERDGSAELFQAACRVTGKRMRFGFVTGAGHEHGGQFRRAEPEQPPGGEQFAHPGSAWPAIEPSTSAVTSSRSRCSVSILTASSAGRSWRESSRSLRADRKSVG